MRIRWCRPSSVAIPSPLGCTQVTLTRNNVKEGATVPPVYAPKYPLFAEEGWWVLVGDLNRKTIFSFERIADNGRVVSKEVCCVCVHD